MYIRTSTLSNTNRMLSQLMGSQNALLESQIQLSSQKRINKPSDNSVDASKILTLGNQQNKIATYKTNIATAREQLNMMDSSLAKVIEVLQRANDLNLQGSNQTYSHEQLMAMKGEIDQITASIVDFANTQYNGQYIFSGNNTATPAYTIQDDGSIVYNGTSGNSDSTRSLEIMEGVNIPLNVIGEQIFGSYQAADEVAGTPASGNGIFKALSDLSNALAAEPIDIDNIQAQLQPVQDGLNNVNNIRTQYGAYSSKRLDMTESYLQDLTLSLTQQRSDLEDLDIVKAITDLTNNNYAYQASLQATASSMQISLLNYL